MKIIKLFLALVLTFTTCFSNGLTFVHAEEGTLENSASESTTTEMLSDQQVAPIATEDFIVDVDTNAAGDIIISSSDSQWLDRLYYGEYHNENGLVHAEMTIENNGMVHLVKNYEGVGNLVRDEDGSLLLPASTQVAWGFERGNSRVRFIVDGYDYVEKVVEVTASISKVPEDTRIYVEPQTGDLIIESSDQNWLNEIVSRRYDNSDGLNITDTKNMIYYGVNNRYIENTLVLDGNRIIFSAEKQREYRLYNDVEYEIYIYSPVYEGYVVDGVVLTNAYNRVPQDAAAYVNSEGDIIITSSNRDWLEGIVRLVDKEKEIYPGVWMTNNENFGRAFRNFEQNSNNLVLTDAGVVIDVKTQLRHELFNDTYEMNVDSAGYDGCLLEVTVTHGVKNVPADAAVTTDPESGDIIITSSDSAWLSGIVAWRDDDNDIYPGVWMTNNEDFNRKIQNSEYSNDDLVLVNNAVIISAQVLRDYGFKNNRYDIEISSFGYVDFDTEVIVTHGVKEVPEDARITTDPITGDIVVTSSDRAWLEGIVVLVDRDNSIYPGLWLSNENNYYDVRNYSLNYANLTLTDAGVVFSAERQRNRGLENGHYEVEISSVGYTNIMFDVNVTHGVKAAPSDVRIVVEETTGNVIISSSDKEWIEQVYRGNYELDGVEISSYVSFRVDYEGLGVSNFGRNKHIQLIDGNLVITADAQKVCDIRNGKNEVSVHAYGYAETEPVEVVLTNASKPMPNDIQVAVDPATGNVVISTSDNQWKQALYEGYIQTPTGYRDSMVEYSTGGTFSGWSNDQYSPWLVWDHGNLVIPPDSQTRINLPNGNVMVRFSVYGYENSLTTYQIYVTHGVTLAPSDVTITTLSNGDFLIHSADCAWLENLVLPYDYNNNVKSEVWLSDYETTWATIRNYRYEMENLVLTDDGVLVKAKAQQMAGIVNGEYNVRITSQGYQKVEGLKVTVTHGAKPAPQDIQISVDSATGDIYIDSNDEAWLKALFCKDFGDGYESVIRFNSDENGYSFWSNIYNDSYEYVNGRIRISSAAQKQRGIPNGEYSVNFEAVGYAPIYEDKGYTVTVINGCLYAPEDVEVKVQSNGDILISSNDKDWLNALMKNSGYAEEFNSYINLYDEYGYGNTFYNTSYSKDFELTSEGIVIPVEQIIASSIVPGQVNIEIGADGYTSIEASITILIGAKVFPADAQIYQDENGNLIFASSDQQWLEGLCVDASATQTSVVALWINNGNGWGIANWDEYDDTMQLKDGYVMVSFDRLMSMGVTPGEYNISVRVQGYQYYETYPFVITKGAMKAPEDIEVYVNESGDLVIESNDSAWLDKLVSTLGSYVEIALRADDSSFEWWYGFGNYDENLEVLSRVDNTVVLSQKEMIDNGVEKGQYAVYAFAHGYETVMLGYVEIEVGAKPAPTDVKVTVSSKGDITIKSADKDWLNALCTEDGQFIFNSLDYSYGIPGISWGGDQLIQLKSGSAVITANDIKAWGVSNGTYTASIRVPGYTEVYAGQINIQKSLKRPAAEITVKQQEDGNIFIAISDKTYLKKISDVVIATNASAQMQPVMKYVTVKSDGLLVSKDAFLKNGVIDGEGVEFILLSKEYIDSYILLEDARGCAESPSDIAIHTDEYGNIIVTSSNQDYLNNLFEIEVFYGFDDENYAYYFLSDAVVQEGEVLFYTGNINLKNLSELEEAQLMLRSYGYTYVFDSHQLVDLTGGILPVEQRLFVGDVIELKAANASASAITWSTSNKSIATVDKNGVVKFLKAGKVKITGKAYGETMTIELTCEAIQLDVKAEKNNLVAGDVLEISVNHNTDREIEWTVSNEEVIRFDKETLSVEAVGAGKAELSAKIAGVTKKLSFTVYTVEAGAKLKAEVVDYDKSGMEAGEVKALNVFTDKSAELINHLVKFTSSNTKVITVDENGNITAVAKGSAKVTVEIINDPSKRKMSVDVKVIDRQVREIEVEIADLNVNYNGTEMVADYELIGKGYKIEMNEVLKDREGNELSTAVKWSTSDSKVASIKAEKGVNYLVINGGGQATLTCTANDLRKESVQITVIVKEYAPRLAANKITLNKYTTEGAEVRIYPVYETAVESVRVLEYNSASKSYIETENFAVELTENSVVINALNPSMKKGSYKLRLEVTIDNGRTYGYEISATVAETLPAVTVKVNGYIDTFNTSASELSLTVDHKGNELTGIELAGTEAFVRNFSCDETGKITIHGLEAESNGKLTTKGTVRLYYAGYTVPVEKSITFSSKSVKPSWKTAESTIVYNPNGSENIGVALMDSKSKETVDLTEEHTVKLVSGNVENIWIDAETDKVMMSGFSKSSTVKFEVTHEAWAGALSLSMKVNVSTSLPKAKLGLTTLNVHKDFSPNTVTVVTLDQPNMKLDGTNMVIQAAKPNAETEKLEVVYSQGAVYVFTKDSTIKAGSYKYDLKAKLEDGTELKAVSFTVKVDASEPTYKLSKTSIKLNGLLEKSEEVVLTETLSKNTFGVNVEGIAVELKADKKYPTQTVEDINLQWTEEGIKVSLNETAVKGKYTYVIKPIYSGGVVAAKGVNLSVEVYEKAATAKATLKGSLNTLDISAKVTVTVALTNLIDEIRTIEVEDDRFEVTINEGTVELGLKEGVELSAGTYKLKAKVTTETTGTELPVELSVKAARTLPKIKVVPAAIEIFDTTKKEMLAGSVKLDMGTFGGTVEELISQNKADVDAGYRAELREEEDGIYVDIYLIDGSKIKAGSSTSLKYQVVLAGETDVKKAPSITIKVTDKSTSVKWTLVSLFQ